MTTLVHLRKYMTYSVQTIIGLGPMQGLTYIDSTPLHYWTSLSTLSIENVYDASEKIPLKFNKPFLPLEIELLTANALI